MSLKHICTSEFLYDMSFYYLISITFFIHFPVFFSLREIVILFTQRARFVTLHISSHIYNCSTCQYESSKQIMFWAPLLRCSLWISISLQIEFPSRLIQYHLELFAIHCFLPQRQMISAWQALEALYKTPFCVCAGARFQRGSYFASPRIWRSSETSPRSGSCLVHSSHGLSMFIIYVPLSSWWHSGFM